MCMGLIAGIFDNNTALMFAWSQKAEMVKKRLLKKRGVVLLSLKRTGIFLAKRFFEEWQFYFEKNIFF